MRHIQVKSPTRVDLAGGTLDLWPLYLFFENPKTINLAINIFTYVDLKIDNESVNVHFESKDLNYKRSFSDKNELIQCEDKQLLLVKEFVRFYSPDFGFTLSTKSESPVGGGLGGSSSLCISLIKAFDQALGISRSVLEQVFTARDIEAKILKTPAGCQDHFPPANPGLNIITLKPFMPEVELVDLKGIALEKHLILVDTGKAHHSGINNWQVYKSVIDGDKQTIEALQQICDISNEMAEACLSQNWAQLPLLFKREYKFRTQLCEAFSSPEIQSLENLALQSGAEAVKICGAGGGGCVLVWSSPENQQKVISACEEKGFKVLKIKPVLE